MEEQRGEELCVEEQRGEELCVEEQRGEELCVEEQRGEELCVEEQRGEELCVEEQRGEELCVEEQRGEELCVEEQRGEELCVRAFHPGDVGEVQRIFVEGMMEMIQDTAFRGLRHHPESVLLYAAITAVCVCVTACWLLIGLLPVAALLARYVYSRCVIHATLRRALSTDMGDIRGYYDNTTDSGLWVAELSGAVVGVVAVTPHQGGLGGAVQLQRMSVDRRYRRCGVGVALGHKVKEFASSRGHSAVVLGTTAYTQGPHRLYRRLGFSCVGVTYGYLPPGAKDGLLQRLFYRVRFHHYILDLRSNQEEQPGGATRRSNQGEQPGGAIRRRSNQEEEQPGGATRRRSNQEEQPGGATRRRSNQEELRDSSEVSSSSSGEPLT